MDLDLTWTDVDLINKKRCPYFTGVQEHGNRCIFHLDYESTEELESTFHTRMGPDGTLNIYEDGHICLMSMKYNYRLEEWEETETCNLTGNKEVERAIRFMISYANISNKYHLITTLGELMVVLKMGNF